MIIHELYGKQWLGSSWQQNKKYIGTCITGRSLSPGAGLIRFSGGMLQPHVVTGQGVLLSCGQIGGHLPRRQEGAWTSPMCSPYISVVFPARWEDTKQSWPQSAACSWHVPASLHSLVMWRRCFLLAMWRHGVGVWGKRAAGLGKQFNISREGPGSGLGTNLVVAVEQTVHRDQRFLSPMHSEVPVRGSLPFQGCCSYTLMHKQRLSRYTVIRPHFS